VNVPIGVLIDGQHVICLRCSEDDVYRQRRQAPIWPVNLERYDQSCHDCGTALTRGSFGVQLFDEDKCKECGPAIAIRAACEEGEDA
jgi:hypothetical protein